MKISVTFVKSKISACAQLSILSKFSNKLYTSYQNIHNVPVVTFYICLNINDCIAIKNVQMHTCTIGQHLKLNSLKNKRAFFWDDDISAKRRILFSLQQMMAFNGHLNWILAWWMDSISGFLVNQIFIPSAPFFNFVKDGCMRQRSGKIPNGIFSRVLKLICFFESSDPVILSTIPLSSHPHTS